jgi:hypothetical protein
MTHANYPQGRGGMSQLVDQLRLCASSPKMANYQLLVDAAARIEALEAALREIERHDPKSPAAVVARAVLDKRAGHAS